MADTTVKYQPASEFSFMKLVGVIVVSIILSAVIVAGARKVAPGLPI